MGKIYRLNLICGTCVLLLSHCAAQAQPQTNDECKQARLNGAAVSDASGGLSKTGCSSSSRMRGPDLPSRVLTSTTPAVSQSLFDAARNRFSPVEVSVEVKSQSQETEAAAPEPFRVGGEQIIEAAGSYGDILRYLQALPGVVGTSDTSNEVLVRGGHPIENLYLVDGFEIPNINHLSRLGSTGGFAPMIDSALVQNLVLYTGGYSARFSDHLSSVTEINLLRTKDAHGHMEGDFGIQGVGGLIETKIRQGDLLVSGHHGLLDVVTKDAGMSGVPSYTNELTRYRLARSSGDTITFLNVAGWDSIEITPCQSDDAETSSINSQYSGWRETSAAGWQKVISSRSFGILNFIDSEQVQHIHQEDQFLDPLKAHRTKVGCPLSKNYVQTTPVYIENTNSAVSSVSYSFEWANPTWVVNTGTTARLQRPWFNVAQPVGAYSPYSVVPVRGDTTSLLTHFSTGETGTFAELTYDGLKNFSLRGGSRLQTFALGSHTTWTARASARYHLGEYLALNAAFASYAQMPPYIYILSFEQNRALQPMRSHHRIIGLDYDGIPGSHAHIEAYDKPYFDIPAASEYPSMTLHNIPDQLGDEIVWLPMNSKGYGHASGIELSDVTRIRSKILLHGSVAYARAKFAGQDRILRPSDFDFPWILNLSSNIRIGRGYGFSSRYGYETGRPYTPYDMVDSVAQNRAIYDLRRVNALRAPYYSRLDGQLNKDISLHTLHLEIYAGVDNILNRQNFLSYAWMPSEKVEKVYPVGELYQMPIFPNFGVRFIVR